MVRKIKVHVQSVTVVVVSMGLTWEGQIILCNKKRTRFHSTKLKGSSHRKLGYLKAKHETSIHVVTHGINIFMRYKQNIPKILMYLQKKLKFITCLIKCVLICTAKNNRPYFFFDLLKTL